MIAIFNASTLAASEYGLPWTAVVSHQGVLYGLAADGLYALTGDSSTVAPVVATGFVGDKDGPAKFPMLYAHLGSETETELTVTLDSEGAEEVLEPYELGGQADARVPWQQVPLGRGLRGDRVQLRFTGAGGFWELRGLELEVTPQILRRRG